MSATAWIDEHKSVQTLARLLGERGPQLAVTVLLLALSVDAALILTRALSNPASAPAAGAPLSSPLLQRNVNPTLELANIVNAHLFGSAAATNAADAPATSMPLVLAGVIADRDPKQGQAIIGQSTADAKLYAVGAAIPGGARLYAVYGDRVILERGGGLESLMLPRTVAPGLVALPAAAAPLAESRDNATLLAGMVRIMPVFDAGRLSGYRIFPGGARGSAAFGQMGLRPGDLITAVNGTSLEDPAQAMSVLQTLSSAGSATVTVSRNGAQQEVNLNLANLAEEAGSDAGAAPPATPPPLLRNRLVPGRVAVPQGPTDASARER